MLINRRSVHFQGRKLLETPLLVPSFSSKGFPDVKQLIDIMSEYITESALVSAYDAHYGLIRKKYNFCRVLFVDSGGYEASIDFDLSDAKRTSLKPRSWRQSFYHQTLRGLSFPRETVYVLVNYDNPKSRLKFADQVKRAKKDFRILAPGSFIQEILIKSEPPAKSRKKSGKSTQSEYLNIDEIVKNIEYLQEFQIIGVTEKELGRSMLERMTNVAKLREALIDANLTQPLHVFGALDPISVPLYFFAGADIFDGLTWLRYALYQGLTIYMSNYAALNLSMDTLEYSAATKIYVNNLNCLDTLQRNLRTFAESKNFGVFSDQAEFFEKAYAHFESARRGQ